MILKFSVLRETTFIEQKKKSWAKFEKMHRQKDSNPDEMTRLFVEITDDLSYSRTFYQKRSVRVYLNYLAQMVFLKINKGKKLKLSRFFRFWTHSLPMEFARSWKAMLLSLLIFSGAMIVGVVTTAHDVDFATEVMSPSYIEMTDRNIENGDPMAVYHEHGSSFSSTFNLTLNNTMVSARTYASGLFTGLPTATILIHNGISLGAFHQYLYHKGVLGEAMFVIWIHGILEISAIVIAGGAGFVLGMGFLFPGSFTRMQSFRIAAKRSFKIAMSTIFILIVSGFIEGSVTRYTQMPFIFKALIIGASTLFIVGYFVLYPMYLHRKYIKQQGFKFIDKVPHVEEGKVELFKVREVGEMYNDTLALTRGVFGTFFQSMFALGIPLVMGLVGYYFLMVSDTKEELFWIFNLIESIYPEETTLLNLGAFVSVFLTVLVSVFYSLKLYKEDRRFSAIEFYTYAFKNALKTWPFLLFAVGAYFWRSPWIFPITIVLVPFLFHYTYAGFMNDDPYKEQLKSTNKILGKTWFGSIGFWLLLTVIPMILIFIMGYVFGEKGLAVFSIAIDYLQDNISPLVKDPAPYFNWINFFFYFVFIAIVFLFLILGMIIQYHTVKERIEGINLYKRMMDFGTKNKLFEQAGEGEY